MNDVSMMYDHWQAKQQQLEQPTPANVATYHNTVATLSAYAIGYVSVHVRSNGTVIASIYGDPLVLFQSLRANGFEFSLQVAGWAHNPVNVVTIKRVPDLPTYTRQELVLDESCPF